MNQLASREILWNVGSLPNVILTYVFLLISVAIALLGIWGRVSLWNEGPAAPAHTGRWLERTGDLIKDVMFQARVLRDISAGTFHTLVYLGFLVLLFTTTMVFIDHDLGIKIYHGDFYLAVTVFSDLFGVLLLVGVALFAYRRYVQRPDRLHTRKGDAFLLTALAVLIIQGYALEALRIHATNDPWAAYSPIGKLVGGLFWPLSLHATKQLHFLIWWFHTITVFTVIAVIPYTKFFHLVASTLNLFFRRSDRPKGALSFPGDLEKLMESGEEFSIGLGSLKDYNWKQRLDLDACTSCGRCQEVCPAYNSGKPLSPKWMVLDTRNHMLALHAKDGIQHTPGWVRQTDSALTEWCLSSNGLAAADGGSMQYANNKRSDNALTNESALQLGGAWEARIAGEVLNPDVFWSCTTCMACVEACPVGINHVELIVGNRRNMTLMQGEIPSEAQATLRALENRANPYGDPKDRSNWFRDLDVPVVKTGDSVDYLYWVGCVSSYDPRKQKIAVALVNLMKHAGVSFGVLGNAEGCSGDSARRLGEENLFQSLAKKNIELLRSISFKHLVANCPHCFNTIKNEYPQIGNLADGEQPEVIHHSLLLKRLIEKGKIRITGEIKDKITFHDPCYLGRYNQVYQAPRSALHSVKGLEIVEMERSKERSFCCGAGGGHFWMDMKVGDRVNVLRTEEAAKTGANIVATACPFCMQMMEDGAKLTNREETLKVKDIAEVLWEAVQSSHVR